MRPFPVQKILAFIAAGIAGGCVAAGTQKPALGLAAYFALACVVFAVAHLKEGK